VAGAGGSFSSGVVRDKTMESIGLVKVPFLSYFVDVWSTVRYIFGFEF